VNGSDPMHAAQAPRPLHVKGLVYEEKYDGWRMLALKEAGHVRLVNTVVTRPSGFTR
jgi:ATP-dependent DNA ligase